jgi:hypothetical protein
MHFPLINKKFNKKFALVKLMIDLNVIGYKLLQKSILKYANEYVSHIQMNDNISHFSGCGVH